MNYYFYNTDAKSLNGMRRIEVLLKNGVAITGGPRLYGEKFRKLEPSDILLMYENGEGVVALGKVTESWDGVAHAKPIYYVPGHSDFDPPFEYRIKVNWYRDLTQNPISPETLLLRLNYTPRTTLAMIDKRRREVEELLNETELGSVKYWRFIFRHGAHGESMWQECFQRGIAVIGEYNDDGEPVPDCSELDESAFAKMWKRESFTSITGRISISALRFQMKPGDIVYAKEGKQIVGCGIVLSPYAYDPDIMAGSEVTWEHCVRVRWDAYFKPIDAQLGAERITLLGLRDDRLATLEVLLRASGQALKGPGQELSSNDNQASPPIKTLSEPPLPKSDKKITAGNPYEQNKESREACLAHWGTNCMVCQMSFNERYEEIGEGLIHVHHVKPSSEIDLAYVLDPVNDLRPVCPNCHAVLHQKSPTYSIAEAKKVLQEMGNSNSEEGPHI